MKTLIEQFVKEALTGKNQFTFSFGTDCLYAINIKRGKSRFIYGCYSCNCTDVDKLTLHLLAIVKEVCFLKCIQKRIRKSFQKM